MLRAATWPPTNRNLATHVSQSASSPAAPARYTHLLLILATLLCLAPFLNKAVHVDDYLFIRSAQHIVGHPADPFGIVVNWNGIDEPLSVVTQNPPLACYYLAAAGTLLGWGEAALHLAFLLPAILAVLGTYVLARDFCAHPTAAAIIMLVSPVFWVSATTLMCDVSMLALWLWAVVLWTRGIERGNHLHLASAAGLVALAALTKYFGAALIPLLLAYTVMKKRWRCWPALWLLLPLTTLFAYDWATGARYGIRMISQAANYAGEHRTQTMIWESILSTVSFAGGCTVALIFFWHRLWHWRWVPIALACATALGVALAHTPILSERSWGEIAQIALFATTGLGILSLVVNDWLRCRDRHSTLLALWTLGTLVFTGTINWTVNGRSILPLAPAVAILIIRQLERRPAPIAFRTLWPIIPAAAIGAAVVWADAAFANSTRAAAAELAAQYRPARHSTLWFQGHWGFQYYMEQHGAQAFDIAMARAHLGDHVILPLHNSSVRRLTPDWFAQVARIERPACRWLATMQLDFGAGFYCHRYGLLPYKFGPVPPQAFEIWEMRMMPLFR